MSKKYIVRIQVIGVYDINVEARDEDHALSIAEDMQSSVIKQNGKLIDIDTDHAMIWEEV